MDRTEKVNEQLLIKAIDDLIDNVREAFKNLVLSKNETLVEPINHLLEQWLGFASAVFHDQDKITQAHLSYWQDYLLLCKDLQWRLEENGKLLSKPQSHSFSDYTAGKNKILYQFIEKFHFLLSQHLYLAIKQIFTGRTGEESKKVEFYQHYVATAFSLLDFVNAYPDISQILTALQKETMG